MEIGDGHLDHTVASKITLAQEMHQIQPCIQPEKCISCGIFRSIGPMRTISVVLESSHRALSIRRIISLSGRLFSNRSGQNRGQKVTSGLKSTSEARFSQDMSKFDVNTN